MGKTTEVGVKPTDSIWELKARLCELEPSLSIATVRLHVLGTPIGFHSGGVYDAEVDKQLSVTDCGLASGVEICLCTVATAAGSLSY